MLYYYLFLCSLFQLSGVIIINKDGLKNMDTHVMEPARFNNTQCNKNNFFLNTKDDHVGLLIYGFLNVCVYTLVHLTIWSKIDTHI